jgi:hypothetical protein
VKFYNAFATGFAQQVGKIQFQSSSLILIKEKYLQKWLIEFMF